MIRAEGLALGGFGVDFGIVVRETFWMRCILEVCYCAYMT